MSVTPGDAAASQVPSASVPCRPVILTVDDEPAGVGQGTGLGLDTARRIIVDRHHGSLTVSTAPGETVFRARLPLTQN